MNALNSDQSDTYEQLYLESLDDPESFWLRAAEAIDWDVDPAVALDPIAGPGAHWFPGGSLNTCYNALDRHVEAGRGDQAALIYDSPVTGTVATYTCKATPWEVARFADVLAGLGVEKGDRVLIYMPMIPEAVIAMLATARLGAIHSVVFGGFAADELAARIDDAEPKVIVSASCGIERTKPIAYKPLLDQAIETAEHTPGAQVIKQRPQLVAELGPLDVDWDEQMAAASPIESVPVKSDDPLYILYTSGTTGKPRCRARQRWARGRSAVEHDEHLRHRTRRRLLGSERRGLGRRALLHRLRTVACGRDDRALRRQASGHSGCWCLWPSDC